MEQRRILCLDMDAFFASVEQATNPWLLGKPIAVAGSSDRTVILSPSYEARKHGVRTGHTVYEARRVCPSVQIIHSSGKKYTYASGKIAEFLREISPDTTMYSIDEAFMDITQTGCSDQEIAYRIKSWLRTHLRVTGSIGIASSYVLAKMATKINKPDGYFSVDEEHKLAFIDRFKLREIWGIGRRSARALAESGIFTPADVRRYGLDNMINLFGVRGQWVYDTCCGLDKEKPLPKTDDKLKSISHGTTTVTDVYTENIALAYILQLSEAVSYRARNKLYAGKIVTLTVRTNDMRTVSFRRNLGFFTSATHHIYDAAKALFEDNVTMEIPLRHIGVGLSELVYGGAVLANLEDIISGTSEKKITLYNVIDEINSRHNNGLIRGSSLGISYRKQTVISPARPEQQDI